MVPIAKSFEERVKAFEDHFLVRMEAIDRMILPNPFGLEAYVLTTAALDALANIWIQDFPNDEKNSDEKDLRGEKNIPSDIRLSRFLRKFVPNDPDISKIAVLCFLNEWKINVPQDRVLVEKLREKRFELDSNGDFLWRIHPREIDIPRSILMEEISQESRAVNSSHPLASNTISKEFNQLLEKYEYGALIYTLYRCPLIHCSTPSSETLLYSGGPVAQYNSELGSNLLERLQRSVSSTPSISFRVEWIVDLLRKAVSGYINFCRKKDCPPGRSLQAVSPTLNKSKWDKVSKEWGY